MPLSQDDDEFIESNLKVLSKMSTEISGIRNKQVLEYIYRHEFGLALDSLAHIYITSGKPVSSKARALFETLALKMSMEDGDEWKGVTKIRAG